MPSVSSSFPTPSPIFVDPKSPGALTPFMKWPGGKSSELPKIALAAPRSAGRYIEPFLGGGSVLLGVESSVPALGNDMVPELINLYKASASGSVTHLRMLETIAHIWRSFESFELLYQDQASQFVANRLSAEHLVSEFANAELIATLENMGLAQEFLKRLTKDLPKKLVRMKELEKIHGRNLPAEEAAANIEGSVRAAFYMAMREKYNYLRCNNVDSVERDAAFFFIREYCYASMFRFNANGEFNVPYGGLSYNRKDFTVKVSALFAPQMQLRLGNSEFHLADFHDFLDSVKPVAGDFVFVDPPYDSDFSNYDDREFVESDQMRLARYLSELEANVMIVISETPLIRRLYPEDKWHIQTDEMLYKWTVKSRNNRRANHLTITNY